MRRLYLLPAPEDGASSHTLAPSEQHHAERVLRLREGDAVEAIDGTGRLWRGRLRCDAGGARLDELEVVRREEEEVPLVVAAALVKSPRWEALIEQCSELGATDLVPMETARTVVRPDAGRVQRQVERWQRIAHASAKQCERLVPLVVHPPMSFGAIVHDPVERCRVLVDETTREAAWEGLDVRGPTVLLFGPEGGFSPEERALARSLGFAQVGLGRYVLRSATAVSAGLALVRASRDHLWRA
jgi:16S rRNA (uracil1498-N3)-methyltransferase